MKTLYTKVLILGAGAGGFGAAYVLSNNKIPNIVVDKNCSFGGTAVFSGVSCFEPGVSLDGVHQIIADKLLENGGGEVQKSVPAEELYGRVLDISKKVSLPYNWGLSVKADKPYEETLKRCLQFRANYGDCYRFMTDEDELCKVMESLINKEYCTTLFNTEYLNCETSDRNITSVTVAYKGKEIKIYADYFIDCTGSIVLSRDAGCQYSIGDTDGNISGINGVSFVFRVSKHQNTDSLKKEDLPLDSEWINNRMKNIVSVFNTYPNGDINVNMLPTMTGEEWIRLGYKAVEIGRSRVFSYWEYMQKAYGLEEYKIIKIFSPGIREDYRLLGRKVLTLEDVRKPFDISKNFIAIADHAIDIHGVKDAVIGELMHPFGIPIECAFTKEYDNLFVACRGASFTHTVASSARLTRTMMSMGEGVAKYIHYLTETEIG